MTGTPTRRAVLRAFAGWPVAGSAAAALAPPPVVPPGLAADFDPVSTVWLGHDAGHEALTRGLVEALSPHARLAFLVPDEDSAARVRASVPEARVMVEPLAGFFLRDMAVFTREADGVPGLVDLRASQYGAAAWCRARHALGEAREACVAHAERSAAERDGVDRAFAQRLGARLHASPLALEGGGVEVNGRGLMIANAALHRTRNPQRSRAELERELRRLPGVAKVIWLPDGLAEDVLLRGTVIGPYVAWGAGGHTDQFVRFADARTVLLAWPDESDPHPVARLTRSRMRRNHAILADATDLQGRRLRVIKVPMPLIVQRRVVLATDGELERSEQWRVDYFAPSEGRREGQALWQVATASYLNFVVANGVVVLPDFVPHGTPPPVQARVRRLFAAAFPGRRIVFVDGISAHWVGGGLHCAALNQP